MIPLEIIAWSAIAATVSWGLTLRHASRVIACSRAAMRAEIRHSQAETARARIRADQLSRDLDSWKAGCQQGREDVMTLMPLLLARSDPATVSSPITAADTRS